MPYLRGAPKGNQNRLTHGRFTAENKARRRTRRLLKRSIRAGLAEAKQLLAEHGAAIVPGPKKE